MVGGRVLKTLYKTILRSAMVLDSTPEFKALVPSPLPLDVMALIGGENVNFYASDTSLVKAIQGSFRKAPYQDKQKLLDNLFAVTRKLDSLVHLLHRIECDGVEQIPSLPLTSLRIAKCMKIHQPEFMLSYQDKYDTIRQKSRELDNALVLVETARDLLESSKEKEAIVATEKAHIAQKYYRESIAIFPTADAYAYLGWSNFLEGDLEQALHAYERALRLDPDFGNIYNDLGVLKTHLGQEQKAIELFHKAKMASRYSVRDYPCLNLAALYLEKNRPKEALHEYIAALHWIGDTSEKAIIQETIKDIASHLIQDDSISKLIG